MPKGHYVRTKFVPVIDRIMRKTIKTDTCWLWQGSKGKMGHGQIICDRNVHERRFIQMTHRLMWEHVNGPVPEGMCVLHRCDVPNCVNPDHLFIGTKADNSADMVAKGRSKRGEDLPQTKLTEDQVRIIRESDEPQSKIAKRFGISQGRVSAIINRKGWSHVA